MVLGISDYISHTEISHKGVITGDNDPGVTQNGTLTKFRDMQDDIKSDLEDTGDDFDAHDHSSGTNGQPLGTGGVASFADDAIETAKIAANAVNSAKLAANAITEGKIADDTLGAAEHGAVATQSTGSIASGGQYNWSSPTDYPLFHWEGTNADYCRVRRTGTKTWQFHNGDSVARTWTIVYKCSD